MLRTPYILYKEDQRDRKRVFGVNGTRVASKEALSQLETRDALRRKELARYLKQNSLKTGRDYYCSAMLLQHGFTKEHYKRAYEYAQISSKLHYRPARWLVAAAHDRYLKSLGRRQKFGTQAYQSRNGLWKIWPYLKRTTDKERRHYDVTPLGDQLQFIKRLNKAKKFNKILR